MRWKLRDWVCEWDWEGRERESKRRRLVYTKSTVELSAHALLCLVFVWYLFDICLIFVWYLFDICLIFVWDGKQSILRRRLVYSKSTVKLSSSILCHRHHNITEKHCKSFFCLFVLFFKVRAGDPVFMYLEVLACFWSHITCALHLNPLHKTIYKFEASCLFPICYCSVFIAWS